MAGHSVNFQTGLRSIMKGDIMIAPLRSYLSSPEFKGFDLKVRGIGERAPDYYFHPSEHPQWPVRALWLWMVAPSLIMREPRDPTATLAMTAGSIWHEVVERSLLDIGLLVTNEIGFADEALRSRGKADGLVKEHSGQEAPEELFEFKTMKDMILRQIETLDDFIAKYPTYVMQANEYMRMSGYRKMRFLIMALTFPFDMREFVLDYNPQMAHDVETKYREVHQSIADKRVPMCDGCSPKFHCAARAVCESATDEQLHLIVKNAKPLVEA